MKFSVITAVMNRRDRLIEGIENWLNTDLVEEVVVADWSSTDIDPKEIAAISPKVKVIRLEGEKNWVCSKAFNLAAKYAEGEVLCKLDCDYRIEKDFLRSMTPFRSGTFWSGANAKSSIKNQDEQNCFLYGFVCLKKEDFWKINGYNERLLGYGWEDNDLYERLKRLGLKELSVTGGIKHLPHDHVLRYMNQAIPNANLTSTWEANRVCSKLKPWQPEDVPTLYEQIDRVGNLTRIKVRPDPELMKNAVHVLTIHKEPAAQVKWFLDNFRKVYPVENLVVIDDGADRSDVKSIAGPYKFRFFPSDNLKLLKHGGQWWQRLFDIALDYDPTYVVKVDADTKIFRKFNWKPPVNCIFGTRIDDNATIHHVQGGYHGFTADAAKTIAQSGWLKNPQFQDAGFWGVDEWRIKYWQSKNLMSTDWVMMKIANLMQILCVNHPEVSCRWGVDPVNNHDLKYAVTHPHKLF